MDSVSPVTPVSGRKRRKVKYNEDDDDEEKEPDIVSPLRSPLANMINTQRAPIIGSCSPLSSSMLSQHEALIRYLKKKNFYALIYDSGLFSTSRSKSQSPDTREEVTVAASA